MNQIINSIKKNKIVQNAFIIGMGLGIMLHDIQGHNFTFPMDRFHGWHAGILLIIYAVLLNK